MFDTDLEWYVAALITAAVIIVCLALFVPTGKNTALSETAKKDTSSSNSDDDDSRDDSDTGAQSKEEDDAAFAEMIENMKKNMSGEGPGSGGVDSEESLSGETDKYSWRQTNDEMEIVIPWEKHNCADLSTKKGSKNIEYDPKFNHLKLAINGETYFDDDLFAEVDVDSCSFTLEEVKVAKSSSALSSSVAVGESGSFESITAAPSLPLSTEFEIRKNILITLFKKTPTKSEKHWPCCFKGEVRVNTTNKAGNRKVGPPVHKLDVSDKEGLRKTLDSLKKK